MRVQPLRTSPFLRRGEGRCMLARAEAKADGRAAGQAFYAFWCPRGCSLATGEFSQESKNAPQSPNGNYGFTHSYLPARPLRGSPPLSPPGSGGAGVVVTDGTRKSPRRPKCPICAPPGQAPAGLNLGSLGRPQTAALASGGGQIHSFGALSKTEGFAQWNGVWASLPYLG